LPMLISLLPSMISISSAGGLCRASATEVFDRLRNAPRDQAERGGR
jgi:hypothetical protein